MLNNAETAAYEICLTLTRLERDARNAREIDRRARDKKRREQRHTQTTPHNARPHDDDELTGWHLFY